LHNRISQEAWWHLRKNGGIFGQALWMLARWLRRGMEGFQNKTALGISRLVASVHS
jgi:hypothetical protein